MIAALASTAAMSVGAVASTLGLHPLVPFGSFAVALGLLFIPTLGRGDPSLGPGCSTSSLRRLGLRARGYWRLGLRAWGTVAPRVLVALAAVAVVADRHLFVSSSALAPDDLLAAAVVAGALILPRGPRWAALGTGLVVATYVVVAATLIAAKPYHSDAVAAAHGGAELMLAGRHPYADFDLIERLSRFGLGPELATPLEDGTRLRSLQYPALAVLVPAAFLAAGLADVRALYLAEILVLFALVVLSVAPRRRSLALAACVGNLVVLDQFVLAGVDPLWALLALGAWLLRRHRASAAVLGLALAARQPAWLIAPFVIVWAWQHAGRREAMTRAAIALAVALLIHVPFLVTAPLALVQGVTGPALLPLEPWGVGPAKLAADLDLPRVPRLAYVAAAGAAYLAALWALASGRASGPAAPLILPLLPLWLGWRVLQSYFALLPVFAVTGDEVGDVPSEVT